jgi:hypothetical protein
LHPLAFKSAEIVVFAVHLGTHSMPESGQKLPGIVCPIFPRECAVSGLESILRNRFGQNLRLKQIGPK